MLELHNVYFMKKDWKQADAQRWLIKHGIPIKIFDMPRGQHEEHQWRYNVVPKTKFKPDSYVTKILPNKIHMIFGERIRPRI